MFHDVPPAETARDWAEFFRNQEVWGREKKSRGVSSMDGSFPNFIPEQISTHSSGIGSYAADDPRDEVCQSSF
jgi:hypothetical protein